jgi:hypothetical protein
MGSMRYNLQAEEQSPNPRSQNNLDESIDMKDAIDRAIETFSLSKGDRVNRVISVKPNRRRTTTRKPTRPRDRESKLSYHEASQDTDKRRGRRTEKVGKAKGIKGQLKAANGPYDRIIDYASAYSDDSKSAAPGKKNNRKSPLRPGD